MSYAIAMPTGMAGTHHIRYQPLGHYRGIRRHIRKCFWLRWKTPRGRCNALKRLGVSIRSSGNAWSAKGAWPMARHYVMQHALKNQTLMQYGFIIPWEIAEARK